MSDLGARAKRDSQGINLLNKYFLMICFLMHLVTTAIKLKLNFNIPQCSTCTQIMTPNDRNLQSKHLKSQRHLWPLGVVIKTASDWHVDCYMAYDG